MNEVGFDKVKQDDEGIFTVTTRPKLQSLVNRLEDAEAEYEVEKHFCEGEFLSAVVRVHERHLRHIKMIIQP